MISRNHRCVFIHIPKTAGQSVEQYFLDLLGLTWKAREQLLLKFNPDPQRGPPRLAHLTATEYVACGHIDQAQFASYFKFAFVRNPWDRLVSEFEYRRHKKRMDFKAFLFKHFPTSERGDPFRHVIPQCEFICSPDGEFLVDFVGKFENLHGDFDVICQRLQIPNLGLPHRNKSVRRHYMEYYDSETQAFVSEFYKRDVELFGYQFETNRM
jgi:hypothetical protein